MDIIDRLFIKPFLAAGLVALFLGFSQGIAQEPEALSGNEFFFFDDERAFDTDFAPLSEEEVRELTSDVFNSPEFRRLPRLDLQASEQKNDHRDINASDQQTSPASRRAGGPRFDPLANWLSALFQGLQGVLITLLVIVCLCACVVATFFLFRSWRQSARKTDVDDASDEADAEDFQALGETPPDQWLESARKAADQGDYDRAISLLLFGAMGHIERAGLIRSRRGLTYRDYLNAAPGDSPWRLVLHQLVRSYAPIGFGRRRGTRPMFDVLVEPYESALRGLTKPGGTRSDSPLGAEAAPS